MLIHLPSCPVKKYRGRTPKPSEHPSRPSFEAVKEESQEYQRSQATYFGVEPKSKENTKLDYSASVLAVLKRFGYDINRFNVHSLTNVISLASDVHEAFDRLELYFEATASFGISEPQHSSGTVSLQSQEDCYEVKWFDGKPHPNVRKFVKFSTSDPEPSRTKPRKQ
ncbi:hypothetical protein V8E55_009395 [Tylopilus felleus]